MLCWVLCHAMEISNESCQDLLCIDDGKESDGVVAVVDVAAVDGWGR